MERVVGRRDSLGLLNESFPSFRQLDDVFLQTQARIWLGEVLKTRLEEDTSIGDLLADGVLLFRVSQVIWEMLITKFMKLRSSNAFFHKSATGKNSGKYMPYSNVDSFLKICQILGLTGADLFSPSDVVEKKDTRRVCICIRSLSKKAILKNINVPDFDVVTYTVSMSKDMVEGICKSLEQSQRRQSEDSSGSATYHNTRHIYGHKIWGAVSARQYDSFSELSDDTDSDYIEDYHVSLLHTDLDNSPRRSSLAAENLHFAGDIFITDDQDDDHDELYSGSCSPSPDAKASLNVYHRPNNNQHSSGFSYPLAETSIIGAVRRAINTLEDETMSTTKPINVFQISVDENNSERNVICQLDTSNQDDGGSGSESDESAVYSEHGMKLFEEIEDDDVSSMTFSDLEQEDIVDLVDKFVLKDAFSNLDVQIPEHLKRVERNIPVDKSTLDTDQLQIHINMERGDSTKFLRTEECQLRIISTESRDPEGAYDGIIGGSSIQASGNQLCITAHPLCEDHEEVPGSSGNFAKEETKHEQVGKDNGASDHKRLRNTLLKSFAGGMSVLGVFFLLLNLRRPNDGGKTMDTIMSPSIQIKKKNSTANIFGKSRPDGVYPGGT
ncbi:mitogen-activated protein kinase kinase kinase [Ranunculus cassubicifolius]